MKRNAIKPNVFIGVCISPDRVTIKPYGIYRSLYLSWSSYNENQMLFTGVCPCLSWWSYYNKTKALIGVCISPDRVAIKPNVFIGVCISPDRVAIKPMNL